MIKNVILNYYICLLR